MTVSQMIDGGTAAFLQQAHRNNWQRYLASLGSAAGGGWDVCILTASDERQAAMYLRQLAWRGESGLLPARTRFVVLADPHGLRIGSGGATLRALLHVAGGADGGEAATDCGPLPAGPQSAAAAPWLRQRILIIHSGGDSRRLPHSSAAGKLFRACAAHAPRRTGFDHFRRVSDLVEWPFGRDAAGCADRRR